MKKSLFEIHIAVALFGLAGLFGKWLTLSPIIIVLGRVFFAAFALGIALLLSRQKLKFVPAKNIIVLFMMGILLAFHWICFFKSIQVSTVAIGLLSYSSFPLFTALLEPLLLQRRMVPKNILFALICIFGVFLIIPGFELTNLIFQGVLWGLSAGLTFSILTIMNRKLAQQYSYLHIAFYQDLSATLCLLPFLFVLGAGLQVNHLFLLFFLGVFCTAAAHALFIKGLKHIKAQSAALVGSLEPVYGIVFAILFLQEIPSVRTVLGGMIILSTVLVSGLFIKSTKS